jgi:hypothetical protein
MNPITDLTDEEFEALQNSLKEKYRNQHKRFIASLKNDLIKHPEWKEFYPYNNL